MLFANAVLFAQLITAGAQEQECHLAKWLRLLYMEFFDEQLQKRAVDWVPRPLLEWNKTMSDQALQEAVVNGSVMKGRYEPYIMFQHEKEFRKIDRLSLKEKVRKILASEEFILSSDHPLDNVGGNAHFGCNGQEEAKDDKEYMKIVCFIEKRMWGVSEYPKRPHLHPMQAYELWFETLHLL